MLDKPLSCCKQANDKLIIITVRFANANDFADIQPISVYGNNPSYRNGVFATQSDSWPIFTASLASRALWTSISAPEVLGTPYATCILTVTPELTIALSRCCPSANEPSS